MSRIKIKQIHPEGGVDGYVLAFDAATDSWIAVPQTGGGAGSGTTGVFSCPPSITDGYAVFLTLPDIISLADANDPANRPAIGIVLNKPNATTAEVQFYGEMDGFTGLGPGVTYFLSETPGQITEIAPVTPGSIVQKIGVAKNANTLVIMVDRDFIEL